MKELIYVRETSNRGSGIFAARNILKDEIITEFKGPRVKIEHVDGIPKEVWDHLLNVGVDEYIIVRDPAARTNHSCDPNAGIKGDVSLVAMRDIKKDEEITFDYLPQTTGRSNAVAGRRPVVKLLETTRTCPRN
jgi:hypothetical protein